MSGYKFTPIQVDTRFQLQTVHEINLNEQYMDASVVITMYWGDSNLQWETSSIFNINSIRAIKSQVWDKVSTLFLN